MKTLKKITFNTNAKILDIGCGDGSITNNMAKIVKDGCVIGTDISHQMVKYASTKFCNQKNLQFIQMDASKNKFCEQFDIITSFNCLHWVKDQESVLSGIYNAALDNAKIILLFSHKKSLFHLSLDAVSSSCKWSSYFCSYINPRIFIDPDSYKKMMIRSGLKVVKIIEEEMTHIFNTKTQLIDFFSAAGSHIHQIPKSLKQEFLNDFADEVIRQTNSGENKLITLNFWCLQVIAIKS